MSNLSGKDDPALFFFDVELMRYLDSKDDKGDAIAEIVQFIHSARSEGVRYSEIVGFACPSKKRTSVHEGGSSNTKPIKHPTQVGRYLEELVTMGLLQRIEKSEPGRRAKKKFVKPSVYYRIDKNFMRREAGKSFDREARVVLRYRQLAMAQEMLKEMGVEDPMASINARLEGRCTDVTVIQSTADDEKEDAEWEAYGKRIGAKPGQVLVFKGRVGEWWPSTSSPAPSRAPPRP